MAKRNPYFEARLVWHVIDRDECVAGSWTIEEKAREHAASIGGYYMLVCNVLAAWGPWRKLKAPDGSMLRVQSADVDWTADDYDAWWSRVNVRVEARHAA